MKKLFFLTLLLACFMVLLLSMTGCRPHPPRPPLSVEDVKKLSAEFDGISNAHRIVRAIILLDLKMNRNTNAFDMISNERVFYQPDTLLACGWAR